MKITKIICWFRGHRWVKDFWWYEERKEVYGTECKRCKIKYIKFIEKSKTNFY